MFEPRVFWHVFVRVFVCVCACFVCAAGHGAESTASSRPEAAAPPAWAPRRPPHPPPRAASPGKEAKLERPRRPRQVGDAVGLGGERVALRTLLLRLPLLLRAVVLLLWRRR